MLENYTHYSLRKKVHDMVAESQEAILDELKPTDAQLQRGLELHFNNYVADLQGSINVSSPFTISSDRLEEEMTAMKDSCVFAEKQDEFQNPNATPFGDIVEENENFRFCIQ